MQSKWIMLSGFLFLFSVGSLVLAYAQTVKAEEAANTTVSVNESAKTVSIIVNGKAVAVFSEDGLLVNGNLSYTGSDTAVSPSPQKDK